VTEGDKGQASKVSADVDKAIEARVKQYIDTEKVNKQHINYTAKNGVLTLTGDVDSNETRAKMETTFATIDGVTQVVDKLNVKNANRKPQSGHKDVSGR